MRYIASAILVAAISGCSNDDQITQPDERAGRTRPGPRYELEKLTASLGGTVSSGNSISHRGWVAGYSNEPGDSTRHAALWRHGGVQDLGTLGGPNSNVQWPGQNDRGTIVGIAETAELDSLGEDWSCAAFWPGGVATGHVCRGFVWQDGVMRALPTFGGTHGFATGVNNRGQVVGWAETPVHDPTCNGKQVLQFRAALWEPRKGRMTELPPFPGDSTSAATAINERGQAVGISGECDVAVGRFSARRAVRWYKGRVQKLDDLGGVSWHTPMDINQAGDIVGFSNPPGDPNGEFIARAVIWPRRGGIESLDLLREDDAFSQAYAINARRQVVGRSCGADGCRAFLWHRGVMQDLNDLVRRDSSDVLFAAHHINDAGQITGRMLDGTTGENIVFVATPRGRDRD